MKAHPKPLSLPEEILLLVLRDREGTLTAAWWKQALAGAVLAELLLTGRIAVDPDKKALVSVVKEGPLGDAVLDECLGKIKTSRRRTDLRGWVIYFSAVLSKLHHRVAERLCQRGILKADEDKILGIFKRRIFPEIDPKPEQELIERLRRAMFTDDQDIDLRTRILLSLAQGAQLLAIPFKKQDLKRAKARIAHLIEGEPAGLATAQAVIWQQIQTALIIVIAGGYWR